MSAWAAAKPAASSWADDAEKDDDDIGSVPAPVSAFPLPAKQSEDAFPSLAQSVSSAKATKKKEKKKATTISLSEFATGVYVGPGAKSRQASIQDSSKGLTVQEMMILPTGPRERSEEEGQQGLGGAFSAYGGGRGGDRRDDRDREGRGGFGRDRDSGFGRDRDRDGEDDGPSRADEVSNWGEAKKFVPSSSFAGSGGSRGGGGGGFRDRSDDDRRPVEREGPSRADEVDNWGSAKKFTPSASSPALGNSWGRGGGGGFDGPDRRGGGFDGPDRRGVGGGPDGPSKADEVDNWGAAKKFVPSSSTSSSAGGSRGGFDGSGSRDLDADRWGKREGVGSAGGGSTDRPAGERPRLNLQKRTVPLPGEEGAPKENGSAAAVDGESKPSKSDPFGGAKPREVVLTEKGVKVEEEPLKANGVDAKAAAGEVAAAASAPSKPKPNPFGSARPREVALEEKGKDWRKLDEELEKKAAARVETEEEKKLREEIEGLRKKMEALVSGTSVPPAGGERAASADASAPDAAATAATAEGSSSSESEREALSKQVAAKEEELKKMKESWVAKARHAAAAAAAAAGGGGGGAAPRQPGERQDGPRGDRGRPDGAKVDARRREPERATGAASGSRW